MAKVTFEFDYFEDRDDIKAFVHLREILCCLHEVDQAMRSRLKHGGSEKEPIGDDQCRFLEEMRSQLSEVVDL